MSDPNCLNVSLGGPGTEKIKNGKISPRLLHYIGEIILVNRLKKNEATELPKKDSFSLFDSNERNSFFKLFPKKYQQNRFIGEFTLICNKRYPRNSKKRREEHINENELNEIVEIAMNKLGYNVAFQDDARGYDVRGGVPVHVKGKLLSFESSELTALAQEFGVKSEDVNEDYIAEWKSYNREQYAQNEQYGYILTKRNFMDKSAQFMANAIAKSGYDSEIPEERINQIKRNLNTRSLGGVPDEVAPVARAQVAPARAQPDEDNVEPAPQQTPAKRPAKPPQQPAPKAQVAAKVPEAGEQPQHKKPAPIPKKQPAPKAPDDDSDLFEEPEEIPLDEEDKKTPTSLDDLVFTEVEEEKTEFESTKEAPRRRLTKL